MTSSADPKRALISGATGGIGGAVSLQLAAVGYEVLINGRNRSRLEALAHSIRTSGGFVEIVEGDLTQPEEIDRVLEQLSHRSVDTLVHSLGAFLLAPVAETSLDMLDRQLAVNLRAPWELTRRLCSSGCTLRDIVFVNTTASQAARDGTAAYNASKSALTALADTLRIELGGQGTRVLTLFPGRTASAMQEQVCSDEGRPYDPGENMTPDDVASMLVAAVTLPRSAEVTEITVRQRRPGAPR